MLGRLRALASAPAGDPLAGAVFAHLDARLDGPPGAPVALGLSGGGDSVALLHLASAWARERRRPLLALTVDHGLHPASPGWTRAAGVMARDAGARWRALAWEGAKPASGLPAAARAARHALLAEAAREAGACVLLLAHTADDVAEGELLRRRGTPGIGVLRAWAPSPAWPQGRGVFLLRPLLGATRADLRARLAAEGRTWIEDPANADPRYARARTRLWRAAESPGPSPSAPVADLSSRAGPGFGHATPDGRVLALRAGTGGAAGRHALRAALACASGGARRVRAPALQRLLDRLDAGEDFVATAGGARLRVAGATLEVGREPGRDPAGDLALPPGLCVMWDGRFEVRAQAGGWRVGAAGGRLARLGGADRALLSALPPEARRAHPVFLRDGEARLGGDGLEAACWVAARLDAALGRIGAEAELRALLPAFRTSPSS